MVNGRLFGRALITIDGVICYADVILKSTKRLDQHTKVAPFVMSG